LRFIESSRIHFSLLQAEIPNMTAAAALSAAFSRSSQNCCENGAGYERR
jgi:hypothetical protein